MLKELFLKKGYTEDEFNIKYLRYISNEKITYSSIKKEGDDYLLVVPSNYTLQSIKSGIVIEVNPLQPPKALLPIDVTLSGIVMEVKLHSAKAP